MIRRNWTYVLWFAFYVILFERLLNLFGISVSPMIIVFALAVLLLVAAFNLGEPMWRIINGVRPLRLNKELDRLMPLFREVYTESYQNSKRLDKGIKLYIQEDMTINAFAFGKKTLVLTKGSTMLLSDEDIKGLIAHELGHFANGDTIITIITAFCILPYSLLMALLNRLKAKIDEASKKSIIVWIIKGFFDLYYYFFRGIGFISELIIMHQRRKSEYKADIYAFRCGYGAELAGALNNLYEISLNNTGTIKEIMRATHPHITKRIERLEIALDKWGNAKEK